jgi:hypothetical protein
VPPEVYSEVLPAVKPAFAALVRLQSANIAERRAAAAQLAALAAQDALPPIAVMRLAEAIERENDPAVWQSAMSAVVASAHESAERMAYQALQNASAEVRREACNYLAAHGEQKHVDVLMRAMDDPQAAVRLAAIRALGSVGTLDDPQPLVDLLNAEDKLVQVEAALALARLRVESGTAALERFALSTELDLRLRAAQAMGEIGDPLCLPALVAMLGDQPPVQEAAMASLARIAGRDMAAGGAGGPAEAGGPAGAGGALSLDERVSRWRAWYAQSRATAHGGATHDARRL